MEKGEIVFGVFLVSLILAVSVAVVAKPELVPATNGINAPPEFVADLPESKLTKVVFIRYTPGFEKDKLCNNNGVCDPDERGWCSDCRGGGEEPPEEPTACYDFLAGSKPRWNWVEDYYYSDGLEEVSAWATATWESATTGDIFGDGFSENYAWGVYDYANSISYGDYSDPNVIAVTAIWFRGKNIYEYDIMFDTDFFPGTVNLDTVTLHEFGHGAGLGDLYDSVCSEEVMYGIYEGIKTDLQAGDITGIQKLYS